MIMHHNEKDSDIIGRIKSVEYTETNTRSGTPALIFTVNIPDEAGKKGVKNGTLCTVSIGAIAHELRCSICNNNLAEDGLCEHERGEYYDNELCYWIIEKMEPKELSYVIVPSDVYAQNVRVYNVNNKNSEVKESMFYDNPFADVLEETKVVNNVTEATDTKEGKQIDEEVKENEKTSNPIKEEDKTKEEETKEEDKTDKESETKEEDNKSEETSKEESETKEQEETKEEESKEEDSKKEEESKEETKSEEDEDFKKELEEAKLQIAELVKKTKELEAENKKLSNSVNSEKKLRESAEKELIEFRVNKKKALIESINNMRTELNLPEEDVTSLLESTEETLNLTIKNLKEFTAVNKTVLGISKISSPVAVSESKDNTTKIENKKIKNVKESIEDSNNNVVEDYINIFKNIW